MIEHPMIEHPLENNRQLSLPLWLPGQEPEIFSGPPSKVRHSRKHQKSPVGSRARTEKNNEFSKLELTH